MLATSALVQAPRFRLGLESEGSLEGRLVPRKGSAPGILLFESITESPVALSGG